MSRSGCMGLAALFGALLGVGAGHAEAQEYCVSCTQPNALYRCIIENARPGGGQSLQMLCVTRMAKDGGHASCAVKSGTVFECDGAIKRIPWASVDAPAQTQGSDTTPAKPASDPNEPPKTIAEMAKRANEQTAEQIKKANENAKSTGEAIGNATKKTWECLTSLFKQC